LESQAEELGATLGAWNALVRRARLPERQKLAALTVSTYADSDGAGIILSVARFAVDLEVSYSTARRHLTWLREVGLLELTRAGNRRKGTASEYRLIIGPAVGEHLDVLSPARQKALADEMREAERDHSRARGEKKRKADQRSPEMSVENRADEPRPAADQRSSEVSVENPINAQTGVDQRSPMGDLHTFPDPPSRNDLPSRADEEDLRTDVTGPHAPENPTPTKCPDGLSAATRPDGKPACPICRSRATRPGIEVPPPPEERLATVTQLDSRRSA